MLRIISLLCFIGLAFGGLIYHDGRIIGGEETTIDKFPYQISLMSYGYHICGGSIINKNHVLTAAHCTDGKSATNLKIRAGSTSNVKGGVVIQVKEIYQHEKYGKLNKDNDVTVLKLDGDLEFSKQIQPVSLQPNGIEVPIGVKTVVSGWGRTVANVSGGPENLRMVELKTIDFDVCSQKYSKYAKLTARQLCCTSNGHDSCQGDSGGPLVNDGKQIGIVSWGMGCGDDSYPGIYSKVSGLRAWIDEKSQL